VPRKHANASKNLFKPLEDYVIASFGSFECVNSSFSTVRPHMAPRAASEGTKQPIAPPQSERYLETKPNCQKWMLRPSFLEISLRTARGGRENDRKCEVPNVLEHSVPQIVRNWLP
jgi:hypothetical protein